MRFHSFWLPTFSFWWWDIKEVAEVDVEGRERLRVHDGWLDVAWFCVYTLGISLVGGDESTSALGDKRVCVEVVWFVWPACIASSRYVCLRMTSRDLNMILWCKEVHSEGWGVGEVMYVIWRMFDIQIITKKEYLFNRYLGCFEYVGSSFRLLFLRVDCECNRSSSLATVFYSASAFNGDLNQWDVAKVTNMHASKLIRIL